MHFKAFTKSVFDIEQSVIALILNVFKAINGVGFEHKTILSF
jgi:hypothetical protein